MLKEITTNGSEGQVGRHSEGQKEWPPQVVEARRKDVIDGTKRRRARLPRSTPAPT